MELEAARAEADKYVNDSKIEMSWAVKAYEHAEIHYDIITTLDPSFLSLSSTDDFIYNEFRSDFPDFNIEHIEEMDLKSPAAKFKWRHFCNKFEKKVDAFNYGTLLRLDPCLEYDEANSIFATRIQFLAIEIARNREGITKKLYLQKQAEKHQSLVVESKLSTNIQEMSVAGS